MTFDGIRKEPVRKALLKDQGNLCAYCMCALTNDHNVTRIEHYNAQSQSPREQLDYKNMLAVCYGGEGGDPEHYTCDKKRGNADLSIDPRNKSHIDALSYRDNGEIYSTNDNFSKDIETLNLNDDLLVRRRKAALEEIKLHIYKKCKSKKVTTKYLQKLLNKYEIENPKTPYSGIIIWYLHKKIEYAL